ncbi:bacterioferritin [Breoghania sp.]|uniref:bacterioferritin n=1 Tax=Breoghania sp. TaxID=2065378 RepID=UPI002AA7C1FF|nr:bacterioferritin [Breoghania sp.]
MSNDTTIKNLNKALQMEMAAAHQYQLNAQRLDDWGLSKLAAQMREEMQEEWGHSDRFIARVLFLKGVPEIAFEKTPVLHDSLVDLLKADLADEENAIAVYTKAAREAYEVGDIGTKALFEEIVLDEEGHKAWLELQLDLIERLGEKTYSSKLVTIGGDAEETD